MPWIVRGGSRHYARGVRRGREVRYVYFGTGPVAELAARADELRRAEREARARSWVDEEARRTAADAPLDELNEVSDLLARSSMVAAGYRQHDRGAWRRKHGTRGTDDGG